MFRKLIKNKKAQNTAEYAILISLVVAGIIAMQTYAQRALQAKVRDAGGILADAGSDDGLSGTAQYEPYYLETNYTVDRDESDTQRIGQRADGTAFVVQNVDSTRTRAIGGRQESTYNVDFEHGV